MPPLAKNKGRFFSLDTETTGVDMHHGSAPFLVTVCHEDGSQDWWEWDVDPATRRPQVPREDAAEICALLKLGQGCVLHNSKFDAKALVEGGVADRWDWQGVHDTLIAAHLLGSNQPKDLTSLALNWLARDIQPFEDRLQMVVTAARTWVRTQKHETKKKEARLSSWRIVRKGDDDSPSAKDKTWKHDCWLPRAILKLAERGDKEASAWARRFPDAATVLRDYANADSAATLALWQVMRAEVERLGLWEHYLGALAVLPVLMDMESRGVTVNRKRLVDLRADLRRREQEARERCKSIAGGLGYELKMPKGSRNGSLMTFCFEVLKLERIFNPKAKSSSPCLDSKNAIPYYLETLPPGSTEHKFISSLAECRSTGTHAGYLDQYERFLRPLAGEEGGWCVLHPNINPTGTDTCRRSHSNPNSANVSKRNEANLRQCFGPAPGREWWTFDGQNLERRIPAYEAGEEDIIALFERPNEPPYFGSEHLLVCHLLFPVEFEECLRKGESFKEKYKSTIYQRVKNGNFAVQYGAVDRADGLGTADRTYGIKGAQAKIKVRFAKQAALNDYWIKYAEKRGYVETMPVNGAKRGYPLLCSRTTWGGIKPTVPLNYHVQGTAGEWMRRGMVRVHRQLLEWRLDGFDSWICLEVHDELVVDMPRSARHPTKDKRGSNLPRARAIAKLLEQGGEDIGVPTPVSVGWCPGSWDKGVTL